MGRASSGSQSEGGLPAARAGPEDWAEACLVPPSDRLSWDDQPDAGGAQREAGGAGAVQGEPQVLILRAASLHAEAGLAPRAALRRAAAL